MKVVLHGKRQMYAAFALSVLLEEYPFDWDFVMIAASHEIGKQSACQHIENMAPVFTPEISL